jgi:hypothetical protein
MACPQPECAHREEALIRVPPRSTHAQTVCRDKSGSKIVA